MSSDFVQSSKGKNCANKTDDVKFCVHELFISQTFQFSKETFCLYCHFLPQLPSKVHIPEQSNRTAEQNPEKREKVH